MISKFGLPNIRKPSVRGSLMCRLKIFSQSPSLIVLYAGHLKKKYERSPQFCSHSFCKLESQTSNDQTSPYEDYQSKFIIDNGLYNIDVLQNGTDHLVFYRKKSFKCFLNDDKVGDIFFLKSGRSFQCLVVDYKTLSMYYIVLI